ncbi:hypothetical protein GKZ68_21550 (plasmid) [Hymenobacter sp. BRD128]|uniref:hypothetical protein n=1 Tax=Hymenobacter sp. BRD128 TaxID=2675878 RepID=UPI0015676183|nr:hypothetical protein [Hymenobacter sp. BRD128]QKG59268.1 hypothetical protein GKZ68_21550 [Hymenobacter sp. BRD128]
MRQSLTHLLLLGTLCAGVRERAWAQRSYCRQFTQGAVLTTAGDTLVGRVELQVHADQLLVFRPNGTVVALPASRLRLAALQGERQYYLPAGGRAGTGGRAALLAAGGRRWIEGGSFVGKQPEVTLQTPFVWLDSTTVFLFRSYPSPDPGPASRHAPPSSSSNNSAMGPTCSCAASS